MRRNDTAQVSGCAGSDDKQLDATIGRLSNEPHHALGGSMGGGNGHLGRNAKFVQRVNRRLHDRRVRIGTHQNQNVNVGHEL